MGNSAKITSEQNISGRRCQEPKCNKLLRRVLKEAGQAVLALSTQCFLHHKNSVSAIATTNFTSPLVKQLLSL